MIEHPEEFADFIKPKGSEEKEDGEDSNPGFPNPTTLTAASKEDKLNTNQEQDINSSLHGSGS